MNLLSDFPTAAATIVFKQRARQHTYQFLMGLKSEYESLRIQILNTSPLPSLYEAFAIIDGDERRRRLIQVSSTTSSGPLPIADQMAFAAFSGSSPRYSGGRPICSYYENTGHIREQCFKLHPKLREQFSKRKGKGHPCTATAADVVCTTSFSGSNATTISANLNGLPCPIPLFEFSQVQVAQGCQNRDPTLDRFGDLSDRIVGSDRGS
ncbi:hypothetical protein Acr_07g0009380 [Actinidia rufa]|uniref:Uncharacterized protein n=1 Tax=Actinidia rufa TaxID=165716 RepID=A0A7J0EW83_9ERIC|nr:hypothetical protein Acr_07g0009380 [Actinidia rufa]